MFFENISFIAVAAAAVVGMVVAVIWYSPWAFGPLWIKTQGWSADALTAKKSKQSMPAVYGLMTAGMALMAFAIAAFMNSLVITGFGGMLLVGFMAWLGFSVPVKLADYLFGGDTVGYFLIVTGQALVSALAMAVVVGIFG